MTWTGQLFGCALSCLLITAAASVGAQSSPSDSRPPGVLPSDASGDEIYRAACAACHSLDGTGQPQSVVGFELPRPNGHDFPDFTDCKTNTVEPLAGWIVPHAACHRPGSHLIGSRR